MRSESIYATSRTIANIEECNFYHTMDIPGYGHVKGHWDLREAVPEYLGNVDFKGKRVLEIGTASGFLCFYIESQGADVVAYDLSEHQAWDIVPFSGHGYDEDIADRKARIKKLNNSFWLCHRAYGSNAKMVYGSVYEIPEEIGKVDISVFAAVLLHLRDPFLALQNALGLTQEKIIVTDVVATQTQKQRWTAKYSAKILGKLGLQVPYLTFVEKPGLPPDLPLMQFFPDFRKRKPDDAFTWWLLTPEIIRQFIGVLGFEKSETKYHSKALAYGRNRLLYTIVGYRTRDIEPT